MNTMMIQLDTFKKLQEFVSKCCGFDAEIELVSGKAVANAKSIMGTLALDFSKPLELRVRADNAQESTIIDLLRAFQYVGQP